MCACTKELKGGQPDGVIVSNNGFAVQQGDWIYFINGGMPAAEAKAIDTSTNRSRIYRMTASGTEATPLSKYKAFDMHIYKDKIFYTSPIVDHVTLRVININGKDDKQLYTFDDAEFVTYGENGVAIAHGTKIVYFDYETLEQKDYEIGNKASGITLSESYIYYFCQNESETKCINTVTGIIDTLCSENGKFLYADDEYIFFVSARVPYRLKISTLELTEISNTLYKNCRLNYKNSAIIAIESSEEASGIYLQPIYNTAGEAVSEDGNKKRIYLHQKDISAYCVDDNYVYFVESETGNIYRSTYEGTNKTVLGTVQSVYSIDAMDVVGDMLFVFDGEANGCAYFVPVDGSTQLNLAVKEEE